MNILLVEDEPAILNAMTRALESFGHKVLWSSTGEAAWTLLQRESVDVLLLDLQLGPGIDGWEVMRRKKLDSKLAKIPVIITTGMSTEAIESHDLQEHPLAGAMLLMPKPIDLNHLELILSMIAKTNPTCGTTTAATTAATTADSNTSLSGEK